MLQRGMVVALTAVVATIMTTESLLAQASSIKKFADLSNRKVCAIHDSEAYTFLTTQMQTQMNVIQNIGSKVRQHDRVSKCTTCYCGHMWTVKFGLTKHLCNQEEMFWLWEQFPQGGSRTCEAVV